ncbi:CBS domain-containing protein [Cupriavidus sp. YR651]|uniref:hypothetical protein n=1 Tax=Cupriavidus sp. YR651 TaxID=1855315 RepID=UPI00087F20A3|nr:hypothetical protein [Cupriavidus sp. YR651]SDE02286.1 CBS domain-containing protein [Cupriavidus sp. YR651]
MTASLLLKQITQRVPGVQHTQSLADALHILACHPSAQAIVVLTGDTPVGVICLDLIADVVGLPCYSTWIKRECCLQFVSHPACVLCVDADATELKRVLAPVAHRHPAEPVVMTANGAYLGIVERGALMTALAQT